MTIPALTPSLKIIFMGTPDFAVPALERLIESHHQVVAVYAQPPRPKGRGQQVQNAPTHDVALAHNIPVFNPRSLKKDEAARAQFKALGADIAVVAAYGLILPLDILEAPRFGCLNIHGSLLPRWRGASPIQHAIWKGDAESGNCIMKMEEGLDTGPVISRRAVPITDDTTSTTLYATLAQLGAQMILDVINDIAARDALPPLEAQDDTKSTYAPMFKKEDGLVNWQQSAREIDCQIRGLNPWPGVFTFNEKGVRVKLLKAAVMPGTTNQPPGTLLARGDVACGGGTILRLITLQPDNSKPMDVAAALNGRYISEGMVLGSSV